MSCDSAWKMYRNPIPLHSYLQTLAEYTMNCCAISECRFQMTLRARKILEEGIFVSIAMLSLAYSGRKTWMNSSGSTRKLHLQEYLQHSFDLTACIVDGDSNVAWKLEGELRLVLHYMKVQEFKSDETKPKHRKGEQQHGSFFICVFSKSARITRKSSFKW